LQERNFVLLPLADFKIRHCATYFKENSELIAISADASVCKMLVLLQFLLKDIPLENYNYIAF
jgi:hypothetical protein